MYELFNMRVLHSKSDSNSYFGNTNKTSNALGTVKLNPRTPNINRNQQKMKRENFFLELFGDTHT